MPLKGGVRTGRLIFEADDGFWGGRVLGGRDMCILFVRRIRSISSGRGRKGGKALGKVRGFAPAWGTNTSCSRGINCVASVGGYTKRRFTVLY